MKQLALCERMNRHRTPSVGLDVLEAAAAERRLCPAAPGSLHAGWPSPGPLAMFEDNHEVLHHSHRMLEHHLRVQRPASRTKCSHQRLAAGLGVEQDPGLGGGPEAAVEARSSIAVEQGSQEVIGSQP